MLLVYVLLMEDQVLAYKASLYGWRTAQIKLPPFDYAEICGYFKNFSAYNKDITYGILCSTL